MKHCRSVISMCRKFRFLLFVSPDPGPPELRDQVTVWRRARRKYLKQYFRLSC